MEADKPQRHKLLIIFYRNPVLGKVKTRLAKTVGASRALKIYDLLTAHTQFVTKDLAVDKALYYSTHIDDNDLWENAVYQKHIQSGDSLGDRMADAFRAGFNAGYSSICIIGTDCFELTEQMLVEAFTRLGATDAIIGPAKDGGYYLLGMNTFHAELFENKSWSTSSVAQSTTNDFQRLGLHFDTLVTLNDVDEEDDLPDTLRLQ